MKLLYIGTHFCPADSLARLLLLGDELVFLDRPSVTFDNWGTIGHQSYMRQVGFPDDAPVKKLVVAPPSGPAHGLYESYAQADIANPAFVKGFLDGLRDDDTFAERFLPPAANYGDGRNGITMRRLIIGDQELYNAKGYDLKSSDPGLMYRPEISEGRRAVARSLLVDASVQITGAQLVADDIDALPISDDGTFPKLLALRASNSRYVGGVHAMAPRLGLEFARAVIPDAALQKIDFSGILDYRRKSSDVHTAWSAAINQCAAKIADAEMANPSDAIQKIIITDLMPQECRVLGYFLLARDVRS